jgi:hypothetical protein
VTPDFAALVFAQIPARFGIVDDVKILYIRPVMLAGNSDFVPQKRR